MKKEKSILTWCMKFLIILLFGTILILTSFHNASARINLPETNGTTRYVAPSGNDSGTCTSPTSPCRTIQYAVNKAASGDTILVAGGVYTYNPNIDNCTFLPPGGKSVVCIVDKSIKIFGGFTINNWVTANPNINITIIDGENKYRGVFLLGYNSKTTNLIMQGFVIQNGKAVGPNTPGDPSGFGGGMLVSGANISLVDIVFKNNKVYGSDTQSGAGGAGTGSGLAINWSQPDTTNILDHVSFEDNQSFGGTGPERGGVAFGALFVNGSIKINYGNFINNKAFAGSSLGSGNSGGLNADALGGAIGGGGGNWELRNIFAKDNQVFGGKAKIYAGGGFGGAIHIEKASSLIISDAYIYNNLARGGDANNGGFGAGGGILINNTPATIERVWIIANSAIGGNSTSNGNAGAGGGGGLYLWKTDNITLPTINIKNSVIADNIVALGDIGGTAAGGGGGGIQIQGLQATITNSTIAHNILKAPLVCGQGLLVLSSPGISAGSATIVNSIISDHNIGSSNAVAVLVQSSNSLTFEKGIFANNGKDTNSDGSPMPVGIINGLSTMIKQSSVGYVSPGEPYYNYHITNISTARDLIDPGQILNQLSSAEDIDKESRPFGQNIDIGADEYVPFPLQISPLNQGLSINWDIAESIFAGGISSYELIVKCQSGANPPNEGLCDQPISIGKASYYTLNGLSNNYIYEIQVIGLSQEGNQIATSQWMTGTPLGLNNKIFLPFIIH